MANTIRIYKSKQAEELDEHFSGSADQLRATYTAALGRYDQYEAQPFSRMVSDLAGEPGVPWEAPVGGVFEKEWASGARGRRNADEVLRLGYRDAMRVALRHDPPVPLETFWVIGAGDDFELHMSDGDNRVTVFMIVPGVVGKDVPAGSSRASSKSWVVTGGDRNPDDRRPKAEQLGNSISKVEVSGA